jgi:hypothetical protein
MSDLSGTRAMPSPGIGRTTRASAKLPEAMSDAHRAARRSAAAETSRPQSVFPAECPWPFDQAMDENVWPRVRVTYPGRS